MDGKKVVITGATSGIGRATAFALGSLGANLLLVSRDSSTGTALARRLEKRSPSISAKFIQADLASFSQVRSAAKQIRELWSNIDILINNAGARFDTYDRTPDHCERTFATNHLGHFLLTGLLVDRLAAAPSARIITVSSSAATQALNDGRWQYEAADYDRKQAYAKSKLANLLFAFELARRLADTKVVSLAVDPGVVATCFARNNGLVPWLKHLLYHARRRELLRPAKAAEALVFLAAAPLPEQASGGYFLNRQPISACLAACDTVAAANLWDLSTSLTGSKTLYLRQTSSKNTNISCPTIDLNYRPTVQSQTTATDFLAIDCAVETERITAAIRAYLQKNRRRGLVLGLSGGIDSTVTAALGVRAVGAERVFGIHMPERQSDEATLVLSRSVAEWLKIPNELEEITPLLEASGFFRRYTAAARQAIPEFDDSWKSKVAIHTSSGAQTFSYFTLIGQAPDGRTVTARLSLQAYLGIVAATNFKQRTRKMLEYYHADRLNFAVAGTPNRLEYDQGFFVKNGDGAADIKPIAHLYKTQVYRLAEYLGVPQEIRQRPPTTDTYSLPQGQDEFYFALPYHQMDLCLYGKNHGLAPEIVAAAAKLDRAMVERTWADIDRKRETTRYLHLKPALVDEVLEISSTT